jgi:hypothetical protein
MIGSNHSRLSAAHAHGRSETKYPLRSMAVEDREQYIGNTMKYRVSHWSLDNIIVSTHLQTLLELLLLLVDYTQPEIDLVCLFEIWLHSHDL